MSGGQSLAVILAAGEGTRMRSSLPKPLHRVAGRSLLGHVLSTVGNCGFKAAVVVGPGHDAIAAEARRFTPDVPLFTQAERRGTADAVLAARKAISPDLHSVFVIFADTPLVSGETLKKFRAALTGKTALVIAGFRPPDPTGYGRIVMKDGVAVAVREERDASEAERAIGLCAGGLIAFSGPLALTILDKIGNENAKKEFYLTDAIAIASGLGLKTAVVEMPEDEVLGIDNKTKLARGEAMIQSKLRAAALNAGVTLVAPETVFFSADTKLGKDVVVEPFVVFGPGVVVGDGAVIRSFSHLEGSQIGEAAIVGPFARLRAGTQLGKGAKVGNFVETKQAVIEAGVKLNHLAYVGDARVGENSNIGAGAVTCNYDGYSKHHTEIGKGAFIGTNVALVAPVKIGDGAYIGTGSVITEDVPADSLAVARTRQTVKEGWASRLRALKGMGKKS